MKCNVCGKEFGNGAYCQNCGSDIITARGNYAGGYKTPDSPNDGFKKTDASNGGQVSRVGNQSEKFMVCYSCANVIPSDSEYCPHCRTKLFEVCPKCGHKYSAQYKICNKCGTDREEYLDEQRKLEQQRHELLQKQEEERKRKLKERKTDKMIGIIVNIIFIIFGIVILLEGV